MEKEDEELLNTVRSMLGANVEIVDCEKTSTVHEEEVILINGIPIKLDGNNGAAVKKALITGEMPSCDLLNEILFQAGVLRQPIHLETSLSVKSSQVTTEEVIVARGGRIIDERLTETQENNEYTSNCQEIWELVHPTISAKTGDVQLTNNCEMTRNGRSIRKQSPKIDAKISPTTSFLNNIPNRLGNSSINSSTSSSNSSVLSSVSSSSLINKQSSTTPMPSQHNNHAEDCNTIITTNTDNKETKFGISKNNSLCKTLQSLSCDSGHHDNDDDYYDNQNQQRTPNSVSSNGCYDFSDDEDSVSNDEIDFIQKRDPITLTLSGHLVHLKPQHNSMRVCNSIIFLFL